MIEIILLLTGTLVWLLIGITALLWLPAFAGLAIGWVLYKTQRKTHLRDKCLDFVIWYADHVLKPIFDPITSHNTYT